MLLRCKGGKHEDKVEWKSFLLGFGVARELWKHQWDRVIVIVLTVNSRYREWPKIAWHDIIVKGIRLNGE